MLCCRGGPAVACTCWFLFSFLARSRPSKLASRLVLLLLLLWYTRCLVSPLGWSGVAPCGAFCERTASHNSCTRARASCSSLVIFKIHAPSQRSRVQHKYEYYDDFGQNLVNHNRIMSSRFSRPHYDEIASTHYFWPSSDEQDFLDQLRGNHGDLF